MENKNYLFKIEDLIHNEKDIGDKIVSSIYEEAEKISKEVVINNDNKNNFESKLDNILTSKLFGYPIMILLLGIIFFITIQGANIPSEMLANLLFGIEDKLTYLFLDVLNTPEWLHGLLILGIYRTLAWVVSVMLPPMAIFFPLFTLLEDLGYLPRVAFNLDNAFRKSGTQGKQALTMSMGFGCNAAGIIATRIIDSPRERLIAIVTNNFVPCNGRFPILIAISMIFIGVLSNSFSSIIATISVVTIILMGIIITLLVSKLLSSTILKGVPSSFSLELPPYRKPQIGKIFIRSIIDRTLFVLSRAILIAAPAGGITWLVANITIGDATILSILAGFLEPFGLLLGMDGMILLGFILGLPANEIVLPLIIMGYMSEGAMIEYESLSSLRALLLNNGWTIITALNVMIFSLLHFPCGTTLLTIKKETKKWKWVAFTFILTTSIAIGVTFITNMIYNLILLI